MTSRIVDQLRLVLGESDVYHDIDSIPLGADYQKHIRDALAKCDIFIVVIGENWLSRGWVDEEDIHRLELETALIRRIHIVPVFLKQAQPLRAADLPPSLRGLRLRQGLRIESEESFHPKMERLVDAILQYRSRRASASARSVLAVCVAVACLISAAFGAWIQSLSSKTEIQVPGFLSSVFCQNKTNSEGAMQLVNKAQRSLPEHQYTISLWEQCTRLQASDQKKCTTDEPAAAAGPKQPALE